MTAYKRLDESSVLEYCFSIQELENEFKGDILDWKAQEVGTGNMNFVFILSGNGNKIVVKQAVPFVRCVGESFPCNVIRTYFDALALKEHGKFDSQVPKIFHVDKDMGLMVMEYFDNYSILRDCFIDCQIIPDIGYNLGRYLGNTLFSSGIILKENPNYYDEFNDNIELKQISIQVIYKDPFGNELLSRLQNGESTWDKVLNEKVKYYGSNIELTKRRDELLYQMENNREALLHGDLHTGSIMVKENNAKIIDAEFVFVGPIAFDIGVLIANFIVSAIIHWDSNLKYSKWILNEISELWDSINSIKKKKNFELDLNTCLRDILGQAGIEIFRRILGIAHLEDFVSLSQDLKNAKELKSLEIASEFILLPDKDYSINIIFDIINSILPK